VWKVEHKCAANESLLIGYEYTYDLLGRVVQSVERHPDNPGTDTTVYTYTPAGRLESEVREGQVAYSRYYGYNLDGSRAMVMRDDALNGTHWDMYGYDSASGRLASVQDAWTGEVHSFVWNPEGTLARWSSNEPNSYARVFGYDEEGRLVKIERDHGSGGAQVAYEYGYNSDSAKVFERRYYTTQHWREMRFIGCGSGCAGSTLSLYTREHNEGRDLAWRRAEEYVSVPTGTLYRVPQSAEEQPFTFALISSTSGYMVHYPNGQTVAPHYTDSGGTQVGGFTLPVCAEKRDWEAGCVPSGTCDNSSLVPYGGDPKPAMNGVAGIPQFGVTSDFYMVLGVSAGIKEIISAILKAMLRGCAIGIAGDMIKKFFEWVSCLATAIFAGRDPSGCPAPFPTACEALMSCLAGAITGGGSALNKQLNEFAKKLISAIAGGTLSGICKGLAAPPASACPSPSPSPMPRTPTPGGGVGVFPPPSGGSSSGNGTGASIGVGNRNCVGGIGILLPGLGFGHVRCY